MKKREPFIFSEKFQKAMDKSVGRAVAASEAAGLPRAYLHSYDELPQGLAQLPEHKKAAE